jgi:hypothetical protein
MAPGEGPWNQPTANTRSSRHFPKFAIQSQPPLLQASESYGHST